MNKRKDDVRIPSRSPLRICDDNRHEKMEYDVHFFLAMTTRHGEMEGHCVACGKLIKYVGARNISFTLISNAGRDSGKSWRNRNPEALVNDQVVKNEYIKARHSKLLGKVSRAPQGVAFELFRMEFVEIVK